jgi:hypothetical protein
MRSFGSNLEPELAALLPPLGNILQACCPNWKLLITGMGKQSIKGLSTGYGAFWVKIERVDATKVIDPLHNPAPDTPNLLYIGDAQAIKKHLIIWNTGWDTQQCPFKMGTQSVCVARKCLKEHK